MFDFHNAKMMIMIMMMATRMKIGGSRNQKVIWVMHLGAYMFCKLFFKQLFRKVFLHKVFCKTFVFIHSSLYRRIVQSYSAEGSKSVDCTFNHLRRCGKTFPLLGKPAICRWLCQLGEYLVRNPKIFRKKSKKNSGLCIADDFVSWVLYLAWEDAYFHYQAHLYHQYDRGAQTGVGGGGVMGGPPRLRRLLL